MVMKMVRLHICAKVRDHRQYLYQLKFHLYMWCDSIGVFMYSELYAHRKCYSKGNACCHHLRLVAIGYEYVMLDYTCVECFMTNHIQCFMLIVKDSCA